MFKLFTDRFSWSPNPIRVVGASAGAGVDSGVISSSAAAVPAHVRAHLHATQSTLNDIESGQPRPAKRRKVAASNMGGRKASVVSPRETKVHANRATVKRGKRDAHLLAAPNVNVNVNGVKVENGLKASDQIEVTDRDLTAAKETVNQRQISRIQNAIDTQMCLEILYKHNELERIDQEIAKCTAALEQLLRCQEQGFTATSGRVEDVRLLLEGRVSSFSTDTPTTLDSPFAKPYKTWLDDPTSGFRSTSQLQCDTCATGLRLDNPHMTRNRNTSTASTSMQALPLGYPKPRRDKSHLGPVIMKRGDGQTVKLQCPQCKREDFANVQGFVNHCRITKHSPSELKTHEDAAVVCGIVVDEESVAAQTQPQSSVLVMNRVEWKVPSSTTTNTAHGSGSTSPKAAPSGKQMQVSAQKRGETTQTQEPGAETVIDGQVSSKAVEDALSENSTLSQKCKASGLLDDFLAFGEEHRLSKQTAETAMSDIEDEDEPNTTEQTQDDDTKTICDSPIEHSTPRKRKPTSRRSIPLKLNQTHGTAALLSVDEADNDPMDLDYDYRDSPTGHSAHSFAHDAPSLTTDDDDEHDVHSARSLTAEPEKMARDADQYTDESEHSRASDKENIYTVKILGSKKVAGASLEKKRRGRPKKVEVEEDEELEEVHLVDVDVDTKVREPESPKRKKVLAPATGKSKASGHGHARRR